MASHPVALSSWPSLTPNFGCLLVAYTALTSRVQSFSKLNFSIPSNPIDHREQVLPIRRGHPSIQQRDHLGTYRAREFAAFSVASVLMTVPAILAVCRGHDHQRFPFGQSKSLVNVLTVELMSGIRNKSAFCMFYGRFLSLSSPTPSPSLP